MNCAPPSKSGIGSTSVWGSHAHAFAGLLFGDQSGFVCTVGLHLAPGPSPVAQAPGTEPPHLHQRLRFAHSHFTSGGRLLSAALLFVFHCRIRHDLAHHRRSSSRQTARENQPHREKPLLAVGKRPVAVGAQASRGYREAVLSGEPETTLCFWFIRLNSWTYLHTPHNFYVLTQSTHHGYLHPLFQLARGFGPSPLSELQVFSAFSLTYIRKCVTGETFTLVCLDMPACSAPERETCRRRRAVGRRAGDQGRSRTVAQGTGCTAADD